MLAWAYDMLGSLDYIFMEHKGQILALPMLYHLERVEMALATPLFKKVVSYALIRLREFSTLQLRAEDN